MQFTIFSAFVYLCFNIKGSLAVPSLYQIKVDISSEDSEYTLEQIDVSFFLYTRASPEVPEQLFIDDVSGLKESAFDANKATKFMTHGWLNTYQGLNCRTVRRAFLAQDDYNVIVVDWSGVANMTYRMACARVKAVGAEVARMINFLESRANSLHNMSLVGHSLGAHVMGLAGYQAANKVGHVVGLDPAGPYFYNARPGEGISKEDGQLVEIIHTTVDCLDISRDAGHADFYVNGGGPKQPNCGLDPNCFCAHAQAYVYYAESLTRPEDWLARRCDSHAAFLKGDCWNNEIVPFPRWSNDGTKKSGAYYLRTRERQPYGLGIGGTMLAWGAE